MKTKIIFWGTDKFGEIIFQKITEKNEISVAGLVTQPDRPMGRKQKIEPKAIALLAREKNIQVWQPDFFSAKFKEKLAAQQVDFFVIAAYGKIIPAEILALPRYGCLNVHPSLLPQYRGPAPIQYCLLNGDKKTGVTIMVIDEKMDHGPIVKQIATAVGEDDDYSILAQKLAKLGATLLFNCLADSMNGKLKTRAQKHTEATYTRLIKKEDGLIDWRETAGTIYNKWRAYKEWPGIYTASRAAEANPGKEGAITKLPEIKIFSTQIDDQGNKMGEFFKKDKRLLVRCGRKTYLEILKIQPAGKKIMDSLSYMNGYRI